MKKTIIILIIMFFVVGCFSKEVVNKNKVKEDRKEYKLSMIMAGDALIHDAVYKDAYISDDKYDFNYMFEDLKPIIDKYDLAFYNQETIIGGKDLGLSTYPRFNSPEEIGEALINTGFNLVSLANNHSLDKGEKGIINSNNYWNSRDVMISGTYNSVDEKNRNNIKTINNISYTLLSYTTSTNGLTVPEGKEYLVNIYSDELVTEDINKVKDKVDVIIVSMHWGEEYNHSPNSEQKRIATLLSELGANIVIGHHPHVLQPIEFIDNTLVVYSLGNLISAQTGFNKLVGMLVSIDIIKNDINDDIIINIDNVQSELIYTYYNQFRNFKVIPYTKLNNNTLPNFEERLKPYVEVINEYEENISVNGDS